MARTPASNDAFFREVDDEVRRERMARAARRYGVVAAIVIVVALAILAGFLLWRNQRDATAGKRGEEMVAAMSSLSAGNIDAARKRLDPLTATDTRGYTPLARVLLADVAIQQANPADGAKRFLAVANDAGTPQPIRDLALVRATALQFDTLSPQQVVSRLKPLAVAGNPWFGSAGELTALAQIRMGKKHEAGTLLAEIARRQDVPQTLRARAGQLAGDLGVEAVQPGDSDRS